MSTGLEILQHALGMDEYGRGDDYRNCFVSGGSGSDHDLCEQLAADGLMERVSVSSALVGGGALFCVTPEGRRYVREHSPRPPKLTRGQQRYQDFLSYDSDMSFGEWLHAFHGAGAR